MQTVEQTPDIGLVISKTGISGSLPEDAVIQINYIFSTIPVNERTLMESERAPFLLSYQAIARFLNDKSHDVNSNARTNLLS